MQGLGPKLLEGCINLGESVEGIKENTRSLQLISAIVGSTLGKLKVGQKPPLYFYHPL